MTFLKYFCVLFFITFIKPASSQSIYSLLSDSSNVVLVAAHRGDHINYPENSIPAVQSCISMGIDIVEIDIQRTRDGYFVLMHDATVNRTTNGRGKVSKYLLKDILKLQLKNSDKTLSTYYVPTLDTILKICKNSIIINIDKSIGQFEELKYLISKLSGKHNIILKSTGSAAFFKLLAHDDTLGITYMPIIRSTISNPDSFIVQSQAKLIEVLAKHDSDLIFKPQISQTLKNYNSNIWLNVLFKSIAAGQNENTNPKCAWDWAISKKAKVIQTDYPFQLMAYLIKHKLHKHPTHVLDTTYYTNLYKNSEIINSISKISITSIKQNTRYSMQYHDVKNGETLSGIAKRYKINLKTIRNYNKHISKHKYLKPGTRLRVK